MRADQRARRDDFLNKLDAGSVGVRPVGAHPVVMGILNVTPDSFSDGGRFLMADAAVAHAKAMAAQGGAIIDIGGESTRPGAAPVPEAEELARIGAVVAQLASELAVPVSVDTYKANVAARAVELGAILINDVWGLQKDPAMADTVAAAEAAVVIMHNRSEKDDALDVVADLRRFFDHSLALAMRAGIPEGRIILDPGIGFGKTARQNIDAIARLGELLDYGRPLMIGASRKKFFGARVPDGVERGIEGTLVGTVAVNLAAARAGASLFRVHDVAEHVAALALFAALNERGAGPPTD